MSAVMLPAANVSSLLQAREVGVQLVGQSGRATMR